MDCVAHRALHCAALLMSALSALSAPSYSFEVRFCGLMIPFVPRTCERESWRLAGQRDGNASFHRQHKAAAKLRSSLRIHGSYESSTFQPHAGDWQTLKHYRWSGHTVLLLCFLLRRLHPMGCKQTRGETVLLYPDCTLYFG